MYIYANIDVIITSTVNRLLIGSGLNDILYNTKKYK